MNSTIKAIEEAIEKLEDAKLVPSEIKMSKSTAEDVLSCLLSWYFAKHLKAKIEVGK